MTIAIVSGFLVSIMFTFLSLVHFYWAFSGEMNLNYVIPEIDNEKAFEPTKLMTIGVAVGLLTAAFTILGHVGVFGLFQLNTIFKIGTWAIAILFLLRSVGDFKSVGFFKSVKNTKFAQWDYRLYSPLCLVISILTFLIIFTNTP
jgi:hypothetical protein